MKITASLYQAILDTFPCPPPESGGIIGSRDHDTICAFVYDKGFPLKNAFVYEPNITFLNSTIQEWSNKGISFCGIVHSHPADQDTLSEDDKSYIIDLMNALPPTMHTLYFPIVLPEYQIVSYRATKRDSYISIHFEETIII